MGLKIIPPCVVALSIVACGHDARQDVPRYDLSAATEEMAPVLPDDTESSPRLPAILADESVSDLPASDVEAPAGDEPAYRGVPLSNHIHELKVGRYVEALHYVYVADRPEYAEQAFRHFGESAAEPLARVLKDESLVVRWNAIEALKQIGPEGKAASGALVAAATEDQNLELRLEALMALGNIGPDAHSSIPDLAKLLRATEKHFVAPHGFWRISDAARNSLVEIGPDALPVLVVAAKDVDPTVRLMAAEAFGLFPTEADTVVPPLRGMLKDEEPVVRAIAAKSLGKLGAAARAAGPDLAELLMDYGSYGVGVVYSGNVAANASQALLLVGATPAELWVLITAVEQEAPETGNDGSGKASNDWVRWYAAQALGQLESAGKPGVVALNRLLENDRLRCAAAIALLQIDPARVELQRVVEKCLSVNDLDSRICALRAFRRFIKPDGSSLQSLRRLALEEDGISSILAATIVLRAVPGDPDMTKSLQELLQNRSDDVWRPFGADVERWGDELLDVFATCPEAADAGFRTALNGLRGSWPGDWDLQVLSRIGVRAAPCVDELAALLDQQDDTEGRRVAATALGRIGPASRSAVPALVHALGDPRAVVRAAAGDSLGRIGIVERSVVAGLESCLADEYAVVRKSAVQSLGKMGAPARFTLPRIDRMGDDPSPTIRRLAGEAARSIRGTP
jgi:HEAT repeat protein